MTGPHVPAPKKTPDKPKREAVVWAGVNKSDELAVFGSELAASQWARNPEKGKPGSVWPVKYGDKLSQ